MDAGFTVLEKRWNPLADLGNPIWLRRSEPDFELLNTRLEKLAFRAIDLSHAYPRLTAAEVRDLLLLPSEESDDDLRRKAKQARNIRESLAKSPVVLKHYKKLVILMEHMQRELSTVKADLAKLKAAQKDSAAG